MATPQNVVIPGRGPVLTGHVQFFRRDEADDTYCLRCARRYGIAGPVEVVAEEVGWPLNRCAGCDSLGESPCVCGRPSLAAVGPLRAHCRCEQYLAERRAAIEARKVDGYAVDVHGRRL